MAVNNYIENEVESVKLSKGIKTKYGYNLYNANGTTINGVTVNSTNLNTPIPVFEYVSSQAIAAAGFASAVPIYTFPNDGATWQIVGASVRFTTASSSGTAQVELSASGTAPGSGTNQLSAAMSLSGTANTAVNGTLITTPTVASGGYSLNLVPGGTMTGLVGMVVTVVIQRLS